MKLFSEPSSDKYSGMEMNGNCRGKAIPVHAWTAPLGSRNLRVPEFLDNRQMKVLCLSALCTDCLYTQGDTPGNHFCVKAESNPMPYCGRTEQVNDPNGNRIHDVPACSAVPRPNSPSRIPLSSYICVNMTEPVPEHDHSLRLSC